MELAPETQHLVAQIARFFDVTEERAEAMLRHSAYGSAVAQIENGVITTLNVGGLAAAKYDLERKLDGNFQRRERAKAPTCDQLDLSELNSLEELQWAFASDDDPAIDHFAPTGHPQMRTLGIGRCKIKRLDVSGYSELKELDCSSNAMEHLDCSGSPKLEKLNCQINNLSSLDLSNHHNLKYLLVRYNPLTQSSLTLPEPNVIEELFIDETQFTALDLTRLPKLKKLKIGAGINRLDASPCPQLHSLSLVNSQLDYLNLSGNPNLSEFTVWESSVKEVVCSERQALVIPVLSKKAKLKPTAEQKSAIKTLELHRKAAHYNWDEGLRGLKRILNNKLCDRATATLIYWMGQPGSFLQYARPSDIPAYHQEQYRFIRRLEKQLMEGHFVNNIVAFDPTNFNGEDWTRDSGKENLSGRELPDTLKQALPGTEIEGFDDDKLMTLSLG